MLEMCSNFEWTNEWMVKTNRRSTETIRETQWNLRIEWKEPTNEREKKANKLMRIERIAKRIDVRTVGRDLPM